MASKIPQKEEKPGMEGPETAPDRPLLDLSDAAVKALIRAAKRRGYVTHDQINALSVESKRMLITCSMCPAAAEGQSASSRPFKLLRQADGIGFLSVDAAARQTDRGACPARARPVLCAVNVWRRKCRQVP